MRPFGVSRMVCSGLQQGIRLDGPDFRPGRAHGQLPQPLFDQRQILRRDTQADPYLRRRILDRPLDATHGEIALVHLAEDLFHGRTPR